MKKIGQITLLFCGLLLLQAAFPVFAQGDRSTTSDDVVILRKPIQDLKRSVIEKIEKDDLDLTASFSLEGNITKDIEGDQNIISFTKTSGDKQMIEVAKDAVRAFSDSGYLAYFRRLGAEDLGFTLVQDGSRIFGNIYLAFETKQRAKTIKNMFDFFKYSTLQEDDRSNGGLNYEDRLLMEGLRVKTEDKNLIVSFDYQKPLVQELIERELIKEQNKIKSQAKK